MKEFSEALILYQKATQKEMSVIINDKTKSICFEAAREIPKAAERPEKGSKLWYALATGKTKKGVDKKHGSAVKGQKIKKIANAIYSSRGKSYGYGKALFYKLATDLGAASKKKFNIKHAHGEKAKPGMVPTARLEIIGLEQEHIDKFIQPAVNSAMKKVRDDMVDHANKKLAKIAAQRSGRKMK